ncbi:MAG: transcription termination/antitermination protein NusA [Candidatus Portnoybacteria bacterium]|nr:transcription termination/antitermination protein NusA [Candidatus Portnoybacteria bacterium]
MDKQSFNLAIDQICEEKGISKEKVVETIEMAIAAAYKKDYGHKGQNIKAEFNLQTGDVKMLEIKLVVDESMIKSEEEIAAELEGKGEVKEIEEKELKEGEIRKVRFNPDKHIMLEEAKKINKKIKPGEELSFDIEAHGDFGRIAAQTAKQVIIQRIREAEREAVYQEYKGKEGEVISGVVQRIERGAAFVDIGRTVGVLFPEEQIQGEFYRPGQRLRFLILEVQEDSRGSGVILSRSHPKMIGQLFELEVPEIASGTVEIKSIAREAGSRSKVAVASTESEIDPIGSCVGQRGTRVQAVINELGGEKIDIIEWSEDPAKFIANALAPAKVLNVDIDNNQKIAQVQVPEEQLSLAIGKKGQNVRLAARLTGWKIDVLSGGKKVEETEEAPTEAAADAPEEKLENKTEVVPEGEKAEVAKEEKTEKPKKEKKISKKNKKIKEE